MCRCQHKQGVASDFAGLPTHAPVLPALAAAVSHGAAGAPVAVGEAAGRPKYGWT